MKEFTIKDLEQFSGIKAHTIRIWEQRYGLLKPVRTKTNFRTYTIKDLQLLLNVALLNQNGFKISYIINLEPGKIIQRINHLSTEDNSIKKCINGLIISLFSLEPQEMETILDDAIVTWGLNTTIEKIIIPFCEKTAMLENVHYYFYELPVLSILRKKIINGIENCNPVMNRKQTVVLFLPKGVFHDILLLYNYYILKREGYTIYNLGQNVSTQNLIEFITKKSPDFVITHATSKIISRLRNYIHSFIAHNVAPIYLTTTVGNSKLSESFGDAYIHHYSGLLNVMNRESIAVKS